jgi:hypothetical protein
VYALAVFDKELQIDLEHCLEQAHVRALVQSNLVLPNIDNQDLARRKRKQGALALKVLVLSALSAIRALNIHDQDVLRHGRATLWALVLAHPYALGGLPALLLGHDAELCAEEVIEQRGFARRLRPKDRYKVVVEAGGYHLLDVEICGEVVAAAMLATPHCSVP